MSSLITGFVMRMRKRATNAQEETTPSLEVLGGKCFKPSRFDEEVKADPTVITVDLSKRVLEAPSTVKGAAQDAFRKAYTALEDQTPVEELPRVNKAFVEATGAPPLAKRASFVVYGAQRPPDRLVLNFYIDSIEWARPTEDALGPEPETTRALIDH